MNADDIMTVLENDGNYRIMELFSKKELQKTHNAMNDLQQL